MASQPLAPLPERGDAPRGDTPRPQPLAPEVQAVITLAAEVAIAMRRRNTADSDVGARATRARSAASGGARRGTLRRPFEAASEVAPW
jgi:hypothetical protein